MTIKIPCRQCDKCGQVKPVRYVDIHDDFENRTYYSQCNDGCLDISKHHDCIFCKEIGKKVKATHQCYISDQYSLKLCSTCATKLKNLSKPEEETTNGD